MESANVVNQSLDEAGVDAVSAVRAFVVAVVGASATSAALRGSDAVSFTLVMNGDGVGRVDVSLVRDGTLENLLGCDVVLTPSQKDKH